MSEDYTNKDRAKAAKAALEAYVAHQKIEDEDRKTQLTDLLCDLLHYTNAIFMDFDDLMLQARNHFEEELREEALEIEPDYDPDGPIDYKVEWWTSKQPVDFHAMAGAALNPQPWQKSWVGIRPGIAVGPNLYDVPDLLRLEKHLKRRKEYWQSAIARGAKGDLQDELALLDFAEHTLYQLINRTP